MMGISICVYQSSISKDFNNRNKSFFYTFSKAMSFFSSFAHKLGHTHNALLHMDPFMLQTVYFLGVSALGFCLLMVTDMRVHSADNPSKLDLFFTSVSATTTSSMSVIEMEVFSNNQLLILTFLMFVGGDIFISMVGLQFNLSKLRQTSKDENKVDDTSYFSSVSSTSHVEKEMGVFKVITDPEKSEIKSVSEIDFHYMKYNSIQFLGFVVIAYFMLNHIIGFALIPIYLSIFPSAKNVLSRKGLNPFTFVIFTTVSTFTNCGFLPTNENMIVFQKNSGLQLILIHQILVGNTLYPPCLRFCVWFVGKFVKKAEAKFLLESPNKEIRYYHWLSARHSLLLVFTVVGFVLVQFVMFCFMEWNSEGLRGLNYYERVIGVLFETVNTRHSGETVMDMWKLAPAVWVLFVFMMYLPPYTSYLGTNIDEEKKTKKRNKWVEELMFSPLSNLVIFVILICITERKKMEEDPLNFNTLSIIIEVVSAYGNVGFSKGYNCDAQLKPDANCVSKSYGFSGKWSDEGKFILILTMLFGTLKKNHLNEGRAWKLM